MRSSCGRRLKLGRRPHAGFGQGRRHRLRQHHRRPVRGAGDAAERQRVVGIGAAADFAAGKLDIVGQHVELLGGDAFELVAHLHRGHVGGDRGAGGENGSNRCRPRSTTGPWRCRVRGPPRHRRAKGRAARTTICASTVSWPWPCTVTSAVTVTAPSGSMFTVAIDTAPFFGPARSRAVAVITRREIAHVRHRRLDDGRESRCRRCGPRRAPRRGGA